MNRAGTSALLLAFAASTACSLIVNPHERNRYDPFDGGSADAGLDAGRIDATRPDGGVDGSIDGGVDAGPPTPLAAPILRFPWNGFMTGSVHTGALEPPRNALRPRFIWEPVDGAVAYEIELDWRCEAPTRDSCAFSSPVEGRAEAAEWRPEASLDVSMSAPVGRRYYWRVRACRSAECFDWSDVRYLDVGRQPADFNADGYADLLLGDPGSPGARPFRYDGPALGSPPLRLPTTPDTGSDAYVVPAGDVDGDGFPDAIVFTHATRSAWIYTRTGFADAGIPAYALPSGGGDVNGDGYADIVVGDPRGAGLARVLLGSSRGVDSATEILLESPNPEATGNFGLSVSIASDIDGDGYADVLIGAPRESGTAVAESGRLYVYGGGPSTLGSPSVVNNPEPLLRGGFGIVNAGGDVNCDGLGDFVVAASKVGDPRLHVYLGTRSGLPRFSLLLDVAGLPTEDLGSFASIAADIDGDGSSDLVSSIHVGAPIAGRVGVGVWLGSCDAGIREPLLPLSDTTGWGVAAMGDVDGSGRTVIGSFDASDVVVWSWSDLLARLDVSTRFTAPVAPNTTNIAGPR